MIPTIECRIYRCILVFFLRLFLCFLEKEKVTPEKSNQYFKVKMSIDLLSGDLLLKRWWLVHSRKNNHLWNWVYFSIYHVICPPITEAYTKPAKFIYIYPSFLVWILALSLWTRIKITFKCWEYTSLHKCLGYWCLYIWHQVKYSH